MRSETVARKQYTVDKAVQTDPCIVADFLAAYSLKRLERYITPSLGLQEPQIMTLLFVNNSASRLLEQSGNITQLSPTQRLALLNSRLDSFIDSFFGLGCLVRIDTPSFWALAVSSDSTLTLPPALPVPIASLRFPLADADGHLRAVLTPLSDDGVSAALLILVGLFIAHRELLSSCSVLTSYDDLEDALRSVSPSWLSLGIFVNFAARLTDSDTHKQVLRVLSRALDPWTLANPLSLSWGDGCLASLRLKSRNPLPLRLLATQVAGGPSPANRLATLVVRAAQDFYEILVCNPYASNPTA